ncbi:MAG: type II secretion system protein [Magnetococcales bacterium]|nr:type II secretion system protein [Magnetococcales bacterium]
MKKLLIFLLPSTEKKPAHKGFTFIEMILVIAIVGMIAAVSLPVILALAQSKLSHEQSVMAAGQGRLALERISAELRQASRSGLNIDISTEITFDSSVHHDGPIRYYLKDNGGPGGQDLMRQNTTDRSEHILARGVSNLHFEYERGKKAFQISYIEFGLTITVALDGSGTGAVSHPFRTRIYPRSFL